MIQTKTLENGVRVIVKRMEGLLSVSMGVLVGTGAAFETDREDGISHFIEHMLFKGGKGIAVAVGCLFVTLGPVPALIEIALFAPPSGAYNDDTVLAAESLGLRTVMWSRDTVDWRDKDEEVCYTRATSGLEAGEFILMHPMPHTLAALPRILHYLETHGLSAVTVSENIG